MNTLTANQNFGRHDEHNGLLGISSGSIPLSLLSCQLVIDDDERGPGGPIDCNINC